MIKKFFKQKGVSLTEALVAIFVSTVVMGATYAIYANFQGTFVRQINYNNLKQEARFALHVLQHDSRMAGFKHERSTFGEVQIPVKVLNDDGTEVSDDTEFGEITALNNKIIPIYYSDIIAHFLSEKSNA